MKDKYDDFIDAMASDIKKPATAQDSLKDIGKTIESEVKKAFEKASKEERVKVPKKDIAPEPEEEPEDIDDTDEENDKEDL